MDIPSVRARYENGIQSLRQHLQRFLKNNQPGDLEQRLAGIQVSINRFAPKPPAETPNTEPAPSSTETSTVTSIWQKLRHLLNKKQNNSLEAQLTAIESSLNRFLATIESTSPQNAEAQPSIHSTDSFKWDLSTYDDLPDLKTLRRCRKRYHRLVEIEKESRRLGKMIGQEALLRKCELQVQMEVLLWVWSEVSPID